MDANEPKALLTAKIEMTVVRALEQLARESGATRHAAIVAALRKGVTMVTPDELKATLPAYRL